jgi:4-amino-4-deoxy-L-arabinose transferase-like glycosyltransferase
MRFWKPALVLFLVALVFCAPLFSNLGGGDLENDEAIYSYAVESILATGDWLNPRSAPSDDVVFVEKPPLKFWIVALPIRLGLLPDNEFGLRFWDAVFGGVAFLYIFAFGRRMAGWVCGVVALAILYTFEGLIVQHGLRANAMESALVLAYAGGMYHYVRWADTDSGGRARAHAAAVGLYFFLAFMTKFVAALFLPAILAAASLELPSVRSKALREWRTWLVVASGFVLLAAPWFIYQAFQPEHQIWAIMFGQHVFERFSGSLDRTHVHPWSYYLSYIFRSLLQSRTLWVVLGGALLVHLRVTRERWLAGTLTLYWFWMPLALISFGTSKLLHYTYPFLAPAALAGGYLVATVTSAVVRFAAGRQPTWIDARLAGLAAPVLTVAVPCLLLCYATVPAYPSLRPAPQQHPLRDLRDCIAGIERSAGRRTPPLCVHIRAGYVHSLFFYFRKLGWDSREELPGPAIIDMLDDAAHPRPVLIREDSYLAARAVSEQPEAVRRYIPVSEGVILLLPGPFHTCGY